MKVSKSEFKAKALELLRHVEASGEPLVVTDRGEPRLEVRRFVPKAPSPLDVLRGSVRRYERPLDPVGDADWDALR